MPTTSAVPVTDQPPPTTHELVLQHPRLNDGADMWRLAKASGVLDLNSSYAYLMWCRDFARTSIVARIGDSLAGFVTGYLRPQAPNSLMIWQVATAEQFRGRGIARQMLNELFARCGAQAVVNRLETTITADNEPSIRLFTRFARDHGMPITSQELFTEALFPDPHESEFRYLLGPSPA